MIVELIGPYRDSESGKCVDEDLIRIAVSRHRIAKAGPVVVGHCRYSDGSILVFHNGLNERERSEATKWVEELLSDRKQNANA